MEKLLAEVQRRFETMEQRGEWSDEECQEGDFLLQVRLTVSFQEYRIRRLTYALRRIKEAVDSGDEEAILKAMLWVNHHLERFGK